MLLHSILRFKYTKVAFFVSSILASAVANASRVRADIDYQYFRDFAENKGQFTVGASNIPIFNKNNEKIGIMMQGIPMPDLNIANKNGGFASLIDNAFVSSVQHNRGYGSVQFGDQDNKPDSHTFDYLLTSRNEMTSGENGYLKKPRAYETDYHVPRLHKLVTEVAPISVTDAFIENNDKENYNTYGINGSGRFLSYVRVGSGDQSVYDLVENKITNITDAYNFLTGGGILGVHSVQGHTLWSKGNKLPDNTWVQDSRSLFGTDYGVMPTWGDAGDSGSPLLGYDSKLKKWVAVGVLIGGTQPPNAPYITVFNIHYPGYIKLVKDKFTAGIVQNNTNTEWEWAVDDNDKSTSHIHSEQASLKVNLYNESLSANDSHQSRPSIDYGQDVIFNGDTDGKLILNQDINQGAGALYFNTNFTVAPKEDQTWLGGGISIAEGKYVVWKVKNPENDRLSKIGAGMLYVNGKGKNLGDISIGDGTVIFNQREDENGLKQAFNKVGITSGRPILTLNSEDQINPDNLYFGFRGGRLDLNGNSLTMQYIRHSDSGAQIVNHNTNIGATLTLTGTEPFTADQIQWGQHGEKGKDLYEYKNQWAAGRTDYFVLVGDEPWRYYPTNQDSSKNWKFISSDKATAMQFIVDSKNTSTEFRYKTFEGTLGETDFNKGSNGALDVIYRPKIANSTLLLNGTINLNGNLEVEEGNVIISGRPVPHARDINNKEVILDNEWINTSHTASAMIVKNSATLTIGRNVSEVNTIFSVTDKAVLNLGYRTGQDVCYRSNYSGNTQCDKPNYSQEVLNTIPQTLVKGHIILDNESTANLSNVIFQGRAIAKAGTHINLFSNSLWELTQNSQVGYLTLEDNAHIVLKSRRNGYTNLIVQNDLNGQGVLDFNTNIGSSLGNKLIVNGALRGSLTLLVKDQAKTLSTTDSLTLIQFNPNEENNFTFILQNSENGEPYVDAGAWRYKAKKNLDAIVLTNPYVNPDAPENIKERIKEKAAELQAKQAEQERLAKEQAEQERLAKERAEQERLAKERAEQERAEQERLAKKQAANISSTANMMLSEFAAGVNINLQFARLLNQQLATKNNKTTIWTNFAQQKTRHFSDNYRAYQQNLNINEIGIQSLINDKGQSVGAIFSNAYATNYLSDNATSTTKVNQVTLYLKQQLTPKSFVTMDISYGRSHNELKLKKQNEHFHRQMYSIGLGFGQSFSLFGIELQTLLGMRNYHYNNVSYQFNGININTKDLNLLNYYSELTIAKMWRVEDIEFKPLISLHYDNFVQRELNDKMNIDNISLKQDFGESVYYETGIDINFYQKWQISSRLGVGKGNNSRKAKNAEIKLSYLF